jgi:solute carrier family 45 protein 1/2/4
MANSDEDPAQSGSSRDGASLVREDVEEEEMDQAGVILGIHNMAIAAPQILANVGSSIIFKIWQKPRGTPGDHSFAIVLALGGICVLASSFFVLRIKDDSTAAADAIKDVEGGVGDTDGYDGSTGDHLQPVIRSRRSSMENTPRVSLDRAMLTRNRSFGGAEMN